MSKKCVNCGAELSDNAAFCPHCETKQTEKQTIKQPKLWRKKALIAAVAVIMIAAVIFGISRYHAPKVYDESSAGITYTDRDGTYELMLAFHPDSLINRKPAAVNTFSVAADAQGGFPTLLGIFQNGSEADAEAFFEKVESLVIESFPEDGSTALNCTEAAYDANYSPSARAARIMYTGTSGTNQIRWTLNMKNGDTIYLYQKIEITPLDTVLYTPENTPLATMEDLKVLLETINREVDPNTVVDIYLLPNVYEGDLTLYNRPVNLYGGSDGTNYTTFTGTLTLNVGLPGETQIRGIRFAGESGTGLVVNASAFMFGCSFTGLDTGVSVNNGGMIYTENCTFENNGIGFVYDTIEYHSFAGIFPNNTFINNEIGLQYATLKGDITIALDGCRFSGNGIDIDNAANYPIDTTNAVFE